MCLLYGDMPSSASAFLPGERQYPRVEVDESLVQAGQWGHRRLLLLIEAHRQPLTLQSEARHTLSRSCSVLYRL